MTKSTKRQDGLQLIPLLLRGAAAPLLLLGTTASLAGTAAIRQWVPQTAVLYLSYAIAAVFYLIGPLPVIAKIGKYPLPVAYGFALVWTAIFALLNGLSGAAGEVGSGGVLWAVITIAATASGILGTKLTSR